jgi:VWFA-related protein
MFAKRDILPGAASNLARRILAASQAIEALLVLTFVLLLAPRLNAQTSTAKLGEPPQPPELIQDTLKISTEEVRIPVFVFDDHGHFDPTLSVEDLLIREDGVAQKVAGVYRVPAYVLVLADTGGVNPAKTVRLTSAIAAGLVSEMRPDDWIAIMEVNSNVQVIKGWTKDRTELLNAIRTKLLPTNRDRLADGVVAAADYLQKAPIGNRHLVIISDGYAVRDERAKLDESIKALAGDDIVVHVISYTSLKGERPPITYAKAKSNIPEEIVITAPVMRADGGYVPDPKDILRARAAWAIDLDRLFRGNGDVGKELKRRETEFQNIAEQTGGSAWLAVTVDEMLRQASEAARNIDSQYVVTYRPLRPLAEAKAGEYRKLDVISRRNDLHVRSRRGYRVRVAEK